MPTSGRGRLVNFDDFAEPSFRDMWDSVRIERPVHYTLFTFGESELPYFLVEAAAEGEDTVSITKGQVRISRPMIVTPDTQRPEFRNFFDDEQYEGLVDFLLARTAGFEHLRFENDSGAARIVSDSVEEAVAKLGRQLDADDEDRVAILSAPAGSGGLALLKLAANRVVESAPENVQELRERGFLP